MTPRVPGRRQRTWFFVCGIAALTCPQPASIDGDASGGDLEPLLRRALRRLGHRGPDGEGVHRVPDGALLGHRRLAIIDPAGGRQPLVAPDETALVANGMIYNDREVRARLASEPYATGSDSESILHLLRRGGPDAVAELDGMFAFVHADGDRLVAARDPLGIKPLYRFGVGAAEGFASEVKAFDGVADWVEELPPGHVYDSLDGLRPWYTLPRPQTPDTPAPEAVAEVGAALEAAVLKRLRSDVPLGCLLSGGLDSSLIAALARRHVDVLHTFAIGLEGSGDLAAAREVAEHLGTVHHELVITEEDVRAAMPDVLWHLESADVDLVRSAVGTWFAMRLAAQHVTVVLTGEGADELFAGYEYHASYDDPEQLQAELHRSLGAMHDVNLQRVDRMSMAHGLEARVPYLDKDLVSVAMRTPPALKQADPASGRPCEKWVLRAVAEGLLPESVVWRRKAQFDQGTGLADLMPGLAPARLRAATSADLPPRGRDHEAAWYRSLLRERFVRPDLVLGVAGTWASNRLEVA